MQWIKGSLLAMAIAAFTIIIVEREFERRRVSKR